MRRMQYTHSIMRIALLAFFALVAAAASGPSVWQQAPRSLGKRPQGSSAEGNDFSPLGSSISPVPDGGTEQKRGEEVDEQLYSRQLFVYGRSAQKRLSGSHVLLYGASENDDSLLAEVAKNLALAGVGKMSIRMPQNGRVKAELIGESSDLVAYCAEINPFVQVRAVQDGYQGALDLSAYSVVVVCDADMNKLTKLNAQSRKVGIPLVAVKSMGLSGFIYNDFGDDFEVEDVAGEPSKDVPLRSAMMQEDGTLSLQCIEEESFGLGIGDSCDITMSSGGKSESGVDSLRVVSAEVVSVTSPSSIAVRLLGGSEQEALGHRVAEQLSSNLPAMIKKAVESLTVSHVPIDEALQSPAFTQSNGCLSPKQDRAWSLCLLSAFLAVEGQPVSRPPDSRHTPRSLRTGMLASLIGMGVKKPLTKPRVGGVGAANIDRLVASSFLRCCTSGGGVTCPATVSVLGPMAAQEVIKAITHIHCPISQFLMFESFDSLLPQDFASGAADSGRGGVYGEEVRQELAGLKVFVVGSGAIGCELLKTFSLMGVAERGSSQHGHSDRPAGLWRGVEGEGGGVLLTDMDSIERSNLNRQLLFRQRHVGQPKAIVAAEMSAKLNPRFHVMAHTSRVGRDTEHLFDDAFWEEVDVVVTALDNVDARRYVDEKCVQHHKVLLDSGTLGTKGNTQVVLPFLSESYSSSADPPEEAIPLCTLKSFPYLSDHCVSWARALFTQCFNDDIESLRSALNAAAKPGPALERHLEHMAADDLLRLDQLVQLIGKYSGGDEGKGQEEADGRQSALAQWALALFDKVFNADMAALLEDNPADKLDEDGEPFWGGSRRMPVPCAFDATTAPHMVFAAQSIRLVCRTCGLAAMQPLPAPDKPEQDPLISKLQALLPAGDEGPTPSVIPVAELLPQLAAAVRYLAQHSPDLLAGLQGEEFEKDDLGLGHVAFAAAASNIRCGVYSLPQVDSLHVQRVAGKIVPAVATTTSLVAGLVSLELVKVASERASFRRRMAANASDNDAPAAGAEPIFTDLSVLPLSESQRQAERERLLSRFRNTFANLARPLLAFAQPVEAEGYPSPGGDQTFTMWSVIEATLPEGQGAPTIADLERSLRARLGQPLLELQSVSLGDSLVFASFLHPEEHATGLPLQTLLLHVKGSVDEELAAEGEDDREGKGADAEKKGLDAHELADHALRELSRAFVDLDVVCVSEEGEDYALPKLRLHIDRELLQEDARALHARERAEEERRSRGDGESLVEARAEADADTETTGGDVEAEGAGMGPDEEGSPVEAVKEGWNALKGWASKLRKREEGNEAGPNSAAADQQSAHL